MLSRTSCSSQATASTARLTASELPETTWAPLAMAGPCLTLGLLGGTRQLPWGPREVPRGITQRCAAHDHGACLKLDLLGQQGKGAAGQLTRPVWLPSAGP